jgi:very-short-patch-repair endonuclease
VLTQFKKSLRRSQTDAESVLWYHLRNRYFRGHKFRRQHILCGYIVDFVCLEKRLVIELDGGQHNEERQIRYDSVRTLKLVNEGFVVLRFWNNEIFTNIYGVLETIRRSIK